MTKKQDIVNAALERTMVEQFNDRAILQHELVSMLEKALVTSEANGFIAMYTQDKAYMEIIPYWECVNIKDLIKCLMASLPEFTDLNGVGVGAVAFRDDGFIEV